jgi:PAS domain S-box-containing protein
MRDNRHLRGAGRPRRQRTLATAAVLFAVVFVLRVAEEDPSRFVTLLYALPISLVAVELGMRWGLAAATLALGSFAFWDLTWASDADHSGVDYLARGAAFFVLGGVVGALADRLRRVSEESTRFWELSTDLLCTAGFDGYFKRLNPAWERTLGWTPNELRSRPFVDFVHPEDRERSEAEAARLTTPGHEAVEFENRYRCKDGSYRTLLWSATAMPEERLIYAIARDSTDRKLAERAAAAAREEAERANEAKSEFLSRMSHELRTPLNSVLGFAELLWMDGVTGEQRDYVGQIRKSGRHLLDLINEVLDLSRIEAGQMSMSPEPVQLRAAVVEAVEMIAPEAASRGISLEPDYNEVCDCYVQADQQRLKQVLLNLLSNAVKYNRTDGSVRISCTKGHGGTPSVTVADTGHGIPEERLDRLFSPFDRLGAEHGEEGGTGLGLALSKRLVELMGGRLWAESDVGSGTTFWLELVPAEPPGLAGTRHFSDADAVAAASNSDLTVLYIEDNVSNFELIKSALARLGGPTLLSAMQGRLGIDLAIQHRPDVVLLDLHLPDMHGKDVLSELKSDPRTSSIPVIVLSADATERQVTRLLDASAYAYVTKPVDVRRFLETVQRAAGEREATT